LTAIWFGDDGTWIASATDAEIAGGTTTNAAFTAITSASGYWWPAMDSGANVDAIVNFGQLGFAHTPPDGFKSLCTANLAAPAIVDPSSNFNAIDFTGGGTAAGSGGNAFTWGGNTAMQPDFVAVKDTDTVVEWGICDSSNGATKELNFDTSAIETVAESLLSFNSDGFTLGSDATWNASSSANIAFGFKKDVAAGFAINHNVSHTSGTPTNIAHGLSAVPNMVWAKRTDSTGGWYHYHSNMASQANSHLFLDSTALETTLTDAWGTHTSTNTIIDALPSGTYTIYSFVDVPGFHKSFTYEGNANANGPFLFLGFRPKLVIVHRMDGSVDAWHTKDGWPNYNPVDNYVSLDTTAVSGTYGGYQLDYLSNGFKCRGSGLSTNGAGTLFGMAWADFPFGGSGVSQARAR
jgi:hypothetical protein